jgi:lipopolysaccharide transport system permease protein
VTSKTTIAGSPARDDHFFVYERKRGWAGIDLRELWSYRELLYFLAWRDVLIRYK